MVSQFDACKLDELEEAFDASPLPVFTEPSPDAAACTRRRIFERYGGFDATAERSFTASSLETWGPGPASFSSGPSWHASRRFFIEIGRHTLLFMQSA
jgi:hypothetical protein